MIARFAGDSALDASVAQVALHRIQGSLTDFTFMKGDDLVHAHSTRGRTVIRVSVGSVTGSRESRVVPGSQGTWTGQCQVVVRA